MGSKSFEWVFKNRKHIFPRLHWLEKFGFVRQPKDPKQIPIIINNFNRVTFLRMLISSLEQRGYTNIYILDNDSSYPPLLDYYDNECPYEVIRLGHNYGHEAIWLSGVYKRFWRQYYVYTDPDVVIEKECPDDFMEVFLRLYKKYDKAFRVGFGLRIDDLEADNPSAKKIIEWESQYWTEELEPGAYKALIDTTFALYRPFSCGECRGGKWAFNIRTGSPYIMRHMPWYVTRENASQEELYYASHAGSANTWKLK